MSEAGSDASSWRILDMWIGIGGGSYVSILSRQFMTIRKFKAVYPNQVIKSRPKARITHCVPSLQAPSALSEGADWSSFIIQEGPEVPLQVSDIPFAFPGPSVK